MSMPKDAKVKIINYKSHDDAAEFCILGMKLFVRGIDILFFSATGRRYCDVNNTVVQ